MLHDVFRLPLLYAFVAVVAVDAFGVSLPTTVARAVSFVSNGAVPVMLLLLGVQFTSVDLRRSLRDVALAFAFPNAAVTQAFVLSAAVPTALIPLLLTVKYGGEGSPVPKVVTGTVVATTVGNLVVLTVLIAVLQSGAVF